MNLQKHFETLHDLNGNDVRNKIPKLTSKNSYRVNSYASFKICKSAIEVPSTLLFRPDFSKRYFKCSDIS